MSSFDLSRSNELHQRVQSYVTKCAHGESPDESFDALAVAPGRAPSRLENRRREALRRAGDSTLTKCERLPAFPLCQPMRSRSRGVACHPPELDRVVFRTSGTTGGTQGSLPLRRTGTYRRAARAWGRHMLFPDTNCLHWILLAPPYVSNSSSSLGFMLDDFADAFGASITWGDQPRQARPGSGL